MRRAVAISARCAAGKPSKAWIHCARPISAPSAQTIELLDMFCALKGATVIPRRANARHSAVVTMVLPAYDVVPAMQLVLGQPVDLNRGVGLHLFGRDFPLMISDYQGVSSMYAVLPLFAIFGPGVGPVRGMTIGFGAIAIVLAYLLGRRLYGRPAGLIGAILLATSPSFIFWSRLGVYVVSQVVPLALGAMLCCLRWHATRRSRWLALAGLHRRRPRAAWHQRGQGRPRGAPAQA